MHSRFVRVMLAQGPYADLLCIVPIFADAEAEIQNNVGELVRFVQVAKTREMRYGIRTGHPLTKTKNKQRLFTHTNELFFPPPPHKRFCKGTTCPDMPLMCQNSFRSNLKKWESK